MLHFSQNCNRAISLARYGFAVFPLRPNKRPFANEAVAAALGSEVPREGQGGAKLATRDETTIVRLWTAFPDARIGIATGAASGGLIVLDVDRKDRKDGFQTLFALGYAPPTTAWQQTRSGGAHYLYRGPAGQHLPNDASELGDGLDRRGDGGYIVDYGFDPASSVSSAPDWLLAGGATRTHGDRRPLGDPTLAAPSFDAPVRALNAHDPNDLSRDRWIAVTAEFKQAVASLVPEDVARLTWDIWCSRYDENDLAENDRQWRSIKTTSSGWAALRDGSPARAQLLFGQRSQLDPTGSPGRSFEQILSDARKLIPDDSNVDAVERLCAEAATLPPAKREIALRAMKDATGLSLTALKQQANGQDGESEPDHLELAHRAIAAIGADNIIHAEQYTWKFTETGVWKRCDDRETKQDVQSTLANNGFAVTAARVSGVSDVLKNEVFKPHHEFNRGNPESVNCLNGELVLIDGRWHFQPHRRELYRTTQIPVAYDPNSTTPLFWQFLHDVFRDDPDRDEKINVVLEMMGYSLMSHANREKFVLLIGKGANGKSVLLATLEALLGKENIAGVQPCKFNDRFQRGHLHQKLANIVTELKQGETIADAELKAITSGEPATVEHKHTDPFVMRPFATCWFGTNHMPHTRDYSDAFFRRAIVVTFNRVFQAHEQDAALKDKLAAELPGILNLALWAYARVVARNGFTAPASSLDAQRKWQLEADQVAQFVEASCQRRPDGRVPVEVLYRAYQTWALSSGIRMTVTKQTFGDRLERLDFERTRTSSARMIAGLTLDSQPWTG